jgi:hypothetical protein
MTKALIYDLETLSQNPDEAAVVSMAAVVFDMKYLEDNRYEYEDIISMCQYLKFDVKDQVDNLGRKIQLETLDWWKQQGKEAIKQIKPSTADVNIREMHTLLNRMFITNDVRYVFTRNNTFDPVIFHNICRKLNLNIPYPWWSIRDTKSLIMGLTYGLNIKDDFIPETAEGKYVKHDPRHDITLDVMRLQTILNAKFGE